MFDIRKTLTKIVVARLTLVILVLALIAMPFLHLDTPKVKYMMALIGSLSVGALMGWLARWSVRNLRG